MTRCVSCGHLLGKHGGSGCTVGIERANGVCACRAFLRPQTHVDIDDAIREVLQHARAEIDELLQGEVGFLEAHIDEYPPDTDAVVRHIVRVYQPGSAWEWEEDAE